MLTITRNTFLASLLGITAIVGCNGQSKARIPAPKDDAPLAAKPGKATAIFAGGCFWGTQAVFQRVKGVLHTEAGYDGGSASTATYAQVTTETTNHAESVEVTYDPSKLTYGTLLRIFFSVHDPTTLNRQGADVGTQYRSVIFYRNAEQEQTARRIIKALADEQVYDSPVVTQVVPFKAFYGAEDYHQNYYNLNKRQPYCAMVIQPKIEKFEKIFAHKVKK